MPSSTLCQPSTEQPCDLLSQQLIHLSDIKNLLEEEHMGDVTVECIRCIIAQLYEVSKVIRAVPADILQQYFASKDAVLKNLRNASIELNLTLDQLTTKGKTRRFYKSFLLCMEYLEKVLEQKKDETNAWEGNARQGSPVLFKRDSIIKRPVGNFFSQARQYRDEIVAALDRLEYTCKVFAVGAELWPDQCNQAIAFLHTIHEPIQELCELLDRQEQLSIAISSQYCHLVVTVHQCDEQIQKLIVLIATYRPMCRSSAKRAVHMRQNINQALELLLEESNDILSSVSALLDQVRFQERRSAHLSR